MRTMSGAAAKEHIQKAIEALDAGLVRTSRPGLPRWLAALAGPAAVGLAVGLVGCGSQAEPRPGDADVAADADADDVDDGSIPDARTDADADLGPEICDDYLDNDGDGRCDCMDEECVADDSCMIACPAYGGPYPEGACDDCRDGCDGDGLADCDDPECFDDPACSG